MLTADTITDEQIREVYNLYWREPFLPRAPDRGTIGDLCSLSYSFVAHRSQAIRQRVADIYNARAAEIRNAQKEG